MSAWSSIDPPIDFVALSRSLGCRGRARGNGLREATDLLARRLEGNSPMLIDVELDRAFKPM